MRARTQIAVTALALLLPVVMGQSLHAQDLPQPRHVNDLAPGRHASEPLAEPPAREQDRRLSLPLPARPARSAHPAR